MADTLPRDTDLALGMGAGVRAGGVATFHSTAFLQNHYTAVTVEEPGPTANVIDCRLADTRPNQADGGWWMVWVTACSTTTP